MPGLWVLRQVVAGSNQFAGEQIDLRASLLL
jgi:hypothetical protein